MKEQERKSTGLTHKAEKLRELLIKTDLPLVVFTEGDNDSDNYPYVAYGAVGAEEGEFLDCLQLVNDECVYTDRDEFREALEERYIDDRLSDTEIDALVQREMSEYEPFWRKCIIMHVGN